jgi:hypothetical protein
MTARGPLLILCAYLILWQPLNFAAEVTATLSTLAMRGPVALLELSVHALVSALSLAAGWAVWMGNQSAPPLAAAAVAACGAASVQSLYWTSLPDNIMPGDRLPLAVAAIAHAAGWLTYLRRSRRVRALFPTG